MSPESSERGAGRFSHLPVGLGLGVREAGASFTKVGTRKPEQLGGLGEDESQGGHSEFGVPKGHLGGDVGVRVLPGAPAVSSHLSASLRLPPLPSRLCGVAMAALELLRRAVFPKARSARRGPHGSLPISGRRGPGPICHALMSSGLKGGKVIN